jgi:hypothetical protein
MSGRPLPGAHVFEYDAACAEIGQSLAACEQRNGMASRLQAGSIQAA